METKLNCETRFMRAATSVARFVGSLQAKYELAYIDGKHKDAKMYADMIVMALDGQDFFDHVLDWELRAKEMVAMCDAKLNESKQEINSNNLKVL